MSALTEAAAERLLIRTSFELAAPGLVGARIGLAGRVRLGDGRHRLRHGHLDVRGGRATLSVPPSPGAEITIRRAAQDLLLARAHVAPAAGPAVTGVRVTVEAGTAERGPGGYRYRWALAHQLAPVLRAAFGHPGTTVLPPPAREPRTAWATFVLDAPGTGGHAFREELRRGTIGPADLRAHVESLDAPVRARGHLELDVAGPGDAWTVPIAVTAALLDDARAAAEATVLTALADRPGGVSPWRRRSTDPEISAAARRCLVAAYGTLARHGAGRDVRDAVAACAEADRITG